MKWDTTWLRLRHRTSSLAGCYVTRVDVADSGDQLFVDHKKMPSANVCVYVDRVGFISDVFAIVVQTSDVKRSKLAIF